MKMLAKEKDSKLRLKNEVFLLIKNWGYESYRWFLAKHKKNKQKERKYTKFNM